VRFLTSCRTWLDHYLVKRRALPDLSHVLDARPTPAVPVLEKRIHTRFDKAFVVVIGSELYGDSLAIARNVSAGGILVEMPYAPPLGTIVTVHFQCARDPDPDAPDAPGDIDELVVRAEVKHHHYLNFRTGQGDEDCAAARAIGLRFVEFLESAAPIATDRIQ